MPILFPAILAVALGSCGASDSPGRMRLEFTSDAFKDGQPIPAQFTCDGAGQAPVLHWSDPPAETKSFALVVDDPDAPGGTFRHWGVADVPATARSIGGGQQAGTEVANDFGKAGYGSPCPPRGHGLHHYRFKLFALDVDRLDLGPGARAADVENEASRHTIAQGVITGTYERR